MSLKNPIGDYTTNNDKLWGIYRGVVEDRYDPDRLCRCRIRVLGVHDQLKDKNPLNGIPTEELPWAEPCYGLFEGAVSGNGTWFVPLQGSYVFVFFENGNWMQPRYFLSAPGMPELPPNPEEGFNDPDAEWPRSDWLDEPDTHRLMKRDKLGETTLLEVKLPNIDAGVTIAIGGSWDEHPPMYQAEYPFNNVIYTHGDIYLELDNTEGNRRFHLYHPSNSYMEIGEIGQMTLRNNETRYDIVMKNRLEHTIENHHRCVDMNRSSYVAISEYEEIDINHYRVVHVMDRQDIDVIRWHEVKVADMLDVTVLKSKSIDVLDVEYSSLIKSSYTGIYDLKFYNMHHDKNTNLIDREVVGLNKYKVVANKEEIHIGNSRKSHTKVLDLIQCEGELILRSDTKIIFDAPIFEFHGYEFLDLTDYTAIAGFLEWNGIALGQSAWATIAQSLGTVQETVVMPYPPDPVDPVPVFSISKPTKPPGPPSIPAPPAPPIPPELDYSDVPPEPDECE